MPNFEKAKEEFGGTPQSATLPCRNFLIDAGQLVVFEALTLRAARQSDAVKEANSGSSIKALFALENLQAGMVICRVVDNFLTYISELLSLIFRTKPDTLKSGQQVRFDFILGFQTLPDLIDALVEKRVTELSYSGMEALSKNLLEHLGFELFPDQENSQRARYLIELRNLIVHNRGIINRLFIDRLRDLREPLGEIGGPLHLEYRFAVLSQMFLVTAATDIDARASEKFALPREPMPQAAEVSLDSVIEQALQTSGSRRQEH